MTCRVRIRVGVRIRVEGLPRFVDCRQFKALIISYFIGKYII